VMHAASGVKKCEDCKKICATFGVPVRADNSRGPRGHMGTRCTPLMTPGTLLSRPSITH
jgi:hypothetical protein